MQKIKNFGSHKKSFILMSMGKFLIRAVDDHRYLTIKGELVPEKGKASEFHLAQSGLSTVLVNQSGDYLRPSYGQGQLPIVIGFSKCDRPCIRAETDNTLSVIHSDGNVLCITRHPPLSDKTNVCVAAKVGSLLQTWQFDRVDDGITPNSTLVRITSRHSGSRLTSGAGDVFVLKLQNGYFYLADQKNQYLKAEFKRSGSSEVILTPSKRGPSIRSIGSMFNVVSMGNLAFSAGKGLHVQPPRPNMESQWIVETQAAVSARPVDNDAIVVINVNCARLLRSPPVVRHWNDRVDAVARVIRETKADIVILQEVDDDVVQQLLQRQIVNATIPSDLESCYVINDEGFVASSSDASKVAVVFDNRRFRASGDGFRRGPSVGVRLKFVNMPGVIGVVGVHLKPGDKAFHQKMREQQIQETLESMSKMEECDAFVIGGIFNIGGLSNNPLMERLQRIGYAELPENGVGATFPASLPLAAHTSLWGKEIDSVSTDVLCHRDLSDHCMVRWKLQPKFNNQATRQRFSMLQMTQSPFIFQQERTIVSKMFDALSKNERVPITHASQFSAALVSPHMIEPQEFVIASHPGKATATHTGRQVEVELKHEMFFSSHAHLLDTQPRPTAMLLVHPDDWTVLRQEHTLHANAFGEDFGEVSVQHHVSSRNRLPTATYVAVFKFPGDLFNLPQLQTTLLPIIMNRPLPVGSDPLFIDERLEDTIVYTPANAGVSTRIRPNDKSVVLTKFRSISTVRSGDNKLHYVDAFALLDPPSGDLVAMMNTRTIINSAKAVDAINNVIKYLERECHIITFLSHTRHGALVFYRDVIGNTLITPRILASLLKESRGGAILQAFETHLADIEGYEYVRMWIHGYPHLF